MGNPLHGPTLQDPQPHVILERPWPASTPADCAGASTATPICGLVANLTSVKHPASRQRSRILGLERWQVSLPVH